MKTPEIENFRIRKKVSQNVCYAIYDAIDEHSGDRIYLRVLSPQLNEDEKVIEKFKASARIFNDTEIPNVYSALNYGQAADLHYVVSEPVDYEPLDAIIENEFSLNIPELANVFIQLAKILRNAHLQGQIHGFLNPNNIYLNAKGDVKIDEFGLSWMIPTMLSTECKSSRFLAQYIAPDFYDHPKDKPDGRADIYSVGIILYQILSGYPPFSGDNLTNIKKSHLREKLSLVELKKLPYLADLNAILIKCLHKDKNKRFLNCREFIHSFERLKKKADSSTGTPHLENNPLNENDHPFRKTSKSEGLAKVRLHVNTILWIPVVLCVLMFGAGLLLVHKSMSNKSTNPLQTNALEKQTENIFTKNPTLAALRPDKILRSASDSQHVHIDKPPITDTNFDGSKNVSGLLIIDAIPYADSVYIDNQPYNKNTPQQIRMKSGRHTVRLINSSLNQRWQQTVQLKVGQVIRIKHDFTKTETGKVE